MLACRARSIAEAFADVDLAVSAISFWECVILAARSRLTLPAAIERWRGDLIAKGLRELPRDGPTAILAAQRAITHQDPADRFIAAIALGHHATPVTAEKTLIAGVPGLSAQDARQ